jgi:phosphatidylserine/phosphatidylglycerophosphate/cardiolipin synthase-like enzyme
MRKTARSWLGVILLTTLLTFAGVLLFQNLAGAEKKIEQQLPKLYEADDAEFRRSLSALLGPQIVEGNKVDTLLNGDQVLPAMLTAIQSAKRTITFQLGPDEQPHPPQAAGDRRARRLYRWRRHRRSLARAGAPRRRVARLALPRRRAGGGFSSAPSGRSESMQLMYLLSITAARKSIDLANAYFVPDEMTIKTLVDAARRGVKVRVLTPSGHIDSETVRKASRGSWGPMLEAGIEIAEYQPTMYHVKGLVVDGVFSSVGSTNFDNRSFRLNDEANLNVLNAQFGRVQQDVFNADWSKARRITLEQWQQRPWSERMWERLASLLHTQL